MIEQFEELKSFQTREADLSSVVVDKIGSNEREGVGHVTTADP
jgi:hypothetical protein